MKFVIGAAFYIICIFFLQTLVLAVGAEDDDTTSRTEGKVTELTIESFNKNVGSESHFIMFFAPWCGHCKRLHPTWEKLAEKYNVDGGSVAIAKMDCTKYTSVCAMQEVNGYPTLKIFSKGVEGGVKYRGPRDLPSIEKFIAEQLNLEIETNDDSPEAVSSMIEFSEDTFLEIIKKGNHFVKFYAPWCGHCQRLAPTWELLASTFEHDKSVTIGKLDCTKHKDICGMFEVKGYPTLLWIVDGQKEDKYTGDRSLEDLKKFVVDQIGSQADIPSLSVSSENQSPVVVLTAENFEIAVSSGLTLVQFFAPWCSHCKRLAPIYEELGTKFLSYPQVTIAKVDCTLDINKDLCSEQEVNGFPTLYLYKDGVRKDYDQHRTLDDMFSFITSNIPHEEL